MNKQGVPKAGTNSKTFKGFRIPKNRKTEHKDQTPVVIRHGTNGSWAGVRHFLNVKD